ncbi:MAG: 1-acyl-sn-glycerol-3-phosphate acyltransferase [Chloroflexi bacterium]|nr:1-acyl-sn-glycerol-3-phosphate acyltransferase [Chloroflexota bacterium]
MARKIIFIIVKIFMRVFTRIEVDGLENVPLSGASILTINHLGRLDVFLVFSVVKRDDLTGWVAEKYRKIPLIPFLVKAVNGIWIDRERGDHTAIRHAEDYLKANWMLGFSPEGTRSYTGTMQEAKQGVAYIAAKTSALIVPTAITGTELAQKEILHLRRPKLTLCFGEPFTLPLLERATRADSLKKGTDEIMCRIAALLPEKYRGFYSEHSRLKELLVKGAK